MVGGGGGLESDYSVCPRPFLRPVQDWVWDRDGTGTGRDRDGGTGWDGELDNMSNCHRIQYIYLS